MEAKKRNYRKMCKEQDLLNMSEDEALSIALQMSLNLNDDYKENKDKNQKEEEEDKMDLDKPYNPAPDKLNEQGYESDEDAE